MPSIIDRHLNAPDLTPQERIVYAATFYLTTSYRYGSKNANPLDGAHGTARLNCKTDCTGFVVAVYKEVFPNETRLDLTVLNVAALRISPLFSTVDKPQKGDLILWNGHCGIVVDQALNKFIGAQSSTGVAIADYGLGHWAKQENRIFRRWSA